MESLLGDRIEFCSISPYKYARFLGELDRISTLTYQELGEVKVILDITCLTKVHTLAVAYWLLKRKNKAKEAFKNPGQG